MTITKDATWQQLEGRVGQLRGDLATAERKLREYAAASAAKQLGLVAGETVLVVQRVEVSIRPRGHNNRQPRSMGMGTGP